MQIYPFTEIPEEKRTVWEEFVTGKLANLLKQNTVELVSLTIYSPVVLLGTVIQPSSKKFYIHESTSLNLFHWN